MSEADADIKVHYGSVERTADDIEKASLVVQKQLDEIWAAVKLVTDGWDGEAHGMMLAAKAHFDARGDHIQKTLKQIADTIRQGSMDYQHTDRKASRLFDISY